VKSPKVLNHIPHGRVDPVSQSYPIRRPVRCRSETKNRTF